MSRESKPHLKLNLIRQHATTGEICDAEFIFSHSEPSGSTFSLKIRIVNPHYDSEVYTQTQHYLPYEIHHRTTKFKAPTAPGAYEVIASVLTPSGDELESVKDMLLVTP